MIPAREYRWNREELPAMRKRRLRPRFKNDLVGFLVVGTIALLILDGREGPSEDLGLAWLIAAADSEFEPTAADNIQHRCLFGDPDRMPPGDDVGRLSQTDLTGAGRDRR